MRPPEEVRATPDRGNRIGFGGTAAAPQTGGPDAVSLADLPYPVTGDLVLTEGEVGPVMVALQGAGVELTALHNHVLRESPRVMYLHVHGRGDPVELTSTVKSALAGLRTALDHMATRSGGPGATR
jgi:Domain of Unknown Function (DUF1259)